MALSEAASDEVLESAEEFTLSLGRDMQSALRQNIEQLGSGLKIIDGGKERITEVGRVDLTARDEKGNIVVIELKASIASPSVIAQILVYMSAVADTDEKTVRGIIVAKGFHKQAIFAAKSIPNLELKEYSFQFSFASVHKG
jgi:RecB family endonuclease NucS